MIDYARIPTFPDFFPPTTNSWGTLGNDTLTVGENLSGIGLAGNDTFWTHSSGSKTAYFALYGGAGNDLYQNGGYAGTGLVFEAGNDAADTLKISGSLATTVWFKIIDGNHLYVKPNGMAGTLIADFLKQECKIEKIIFTDGYTTSIDGLWSLLNGAYKNKLSTGTFEELGISSAKFKALNDAKYTTTYGGIGVSASGNDTTKDVYHSASLAKYYYFNESEYLGNKLAALKSNGEKFNTGDEVASAIKNAGMTIWEHFSKYGAYEKAADGTIGINPSDNFDISNYYSAKLKQANATGNNYNINTLVGAFSEAHLDPISHFALYGADEGVKIVGVSQSEVGLL